MIDRLAHAADLGRATRAKADGPGGGHLTLSSDGEFPFEVADVIAAQSLQLPNRWAILKST